MHIHIHGQAGEAKYRMEPQISLAHNSGLSKAELKTVKKLIEDNENDIRKAWERHFGS